MPLIIRVQLSSDFAERNVNKNPKNVRFIPRDDEEKYMTLTCSHTLMSEKKKKHLPQYMIMRVYDLMHCYPYLLPKSQEVLMSCQFGEPNVHISHS